MNTSIPTVQQSALDTNRDVILDIRLHPGKQQIRGALRCDAKAMLQVDRLLLPLPHDRTIAVYGDSDELLASIVERLRGEGFQAAALDGGIEAWAQNGLALEDLTQEQPVPGKSDAGIGLL